ncbi:Ig-like domain-containing protein [Thiomicrospira sp. R3]|uniref:type II secretion system protein n=1 Tax=Thiomicrospira sp. R3 TaxID=3035472 RepID=UPI00259B8DC2|nr:Ig-like domain-containing protein [Thiomicrospira sp. R3]WFE68955.1 Ig-like domain-containing protein [Thiomicrospira sp. R3]
MKNPKKVHAINGFTLIEIALIIAVLGIITAGVISGIGAMRESAKFKEDQVKLQDIKKSLINFVAINGYLPCPDTDNTGTENRNAQTCSSFSGTLPYIDLGTHPLNAWGLPFSYIVNTNVENLSDITDSQSSASYFGNGACADLDTRNNADAPCFRMNTPPILGQTTENLGNYQVSDGANVIANQIPLLVISHGQNGCPGASNFESWNCDLSQFSDNQTQVFQAAQNRHGVNQFDDLLIWISSFDIKISDNHQSVSNNTNLPPEENHTPPPPPEETITVNEESEEIVGGNTVDIIDRLWGGLGDNGFAVGLESNVFTQNNRQVIHTNDLNIENTTNLIIQATEASGSTYFFEVGSVYFLSWSQEGSTRTMLGTISRSDDVSLQDDLRNIVVFRGAVGNIETVLVIDHTGVQRANNLSYAVNDQNANETVGFKAERITGTAPAGSQINIYDKDNNLIDTVTADADGNWTAIIFDPGKVTPITIELVED